MNGFANSFMDMLNSPLMRALVWLVVVLIVATIAKAIVQGIVGGTTLKARLTRGARTPDEGARRYASTLQNAGRLAFLLVFLLFVPAIFTTLGVGEAGEPVFEFLDRMWGFLPNIIAAGIVLWVGMTIAQLVRQLTVPLFARINVDRISQRAGMQGDRTGRANIAEALANVLYAVIAVPVVIVALQVLDISAISDPATNMLNTIIGFVPNMLAAGILLGLGTFVGKLAGNIVEQLVAGTGIDDKAASTMAARMPHEARERGGQVSGGVRVSHVIGMVVKALVIVLFAVEALDLLELSVLSNMGNAVIAYLPNVLAAGIVFAAAAWMAGMAKKALDAGGNGRYAMAAQAGVWVLAAFMVLSQLNIAQTIVQGGFLLMAGAVAVAFAIAFGLGGRDFARRTLQGLEREMPADEAPDAMASAGGRANR